MLEEKTVAVKTIVNLDYLVGEVRLLHCCPGSGHSLILLQAKVTRVGENPQVDMWITHYHLSCFPLAFNKTNMVDMVKLQHGMSFEWEWWSSRRHITCSEKYLVMLETAKY